MLIFIISRNAYKFKINEKNYVINDEKNKTIDNNKNH